MICIEHCESQSKGDNILQFNVFCRQEVHGEQEGNIRLIISSFMTLKYYIKIKKKKKIWKRNWPDWIATTVSF